jgi:hypothetical protein
VRGLPTLPFDQPCSDWGLQLIPPPGHRLLAPQPRRGLLLGKPERDHPDQHQAVDRAVRARPDIPALGSGGLRSLSSNSTWRATWGGQRFSTVSSGSPSRHHRDHPDRLHQSEQVVALPCEEMTGRAGTT